MAPRGFEEMLRHSAELVRQWSESASPMTLDDTTGADVHA